jgi:hypothetical protein
MKRGAKDPMAEFEAARAEMATSAVSVSDLILDAAVRKIDGLFGPGFARANPALVGQYLDATARTFQSDMADVADFDDDYGLDLPRPDLDRRR